MRETIRIQKLPVCLVVLMLTLFALLPVQRLSARYISSDRSSITLVRIAEYTIRFDGNFGTGPDAGTGSGSVADITAGRGEQIILPENAYSRAQDDEYAYVFEGWNTKPDGSGTTYSEGQAVSDLGEPWSTVTLYAKWRRVAGPGYLVSVYGIMEDTYSTDGGQNLKTTGLTFGPASGADYRQAISESGISHTPSGVTASGNSHRCIYEDSWNTIIYWDSVDPYVYEQCRDHACTKTVAVKINSTIGANGYQNYAGKQYSVFYKQIRPEYLRWNKTATTAGGYAATGIRSLLVGADSYTDPSFSTGLTAENCLFSCIQPNLRAAIVPKAVISESAWVLDYKTGTATDYACTYDPFWLLSFHEIFSDPSSFSYGMGEGDTYSRQKVLGITTTTSEGSGNVAFDETNSENGQSHWLRSVRLTTAIAQVNKAARVTVTSGLTHGGGVSSIVTTTSLGVAPGFCLPGPASGVDVTFDLNAPSDISGAFVSSTAKRMRPGAVCGLLPDAGADNYVFAGWFASPEEGSAEILPETVYNGTSTVLYAHWENGETLAPGAAWYRSENTLRSEFKEIRLVQHYTPTGKETDSWNADTFNTGFYKCYAVTENSSKVLIISSEDHGLLKMDHNSSYLFSNPSAMIAQNQAVTDEARKLLFSNVTTISGLENLDASGVNEMAGMFCGCFSLKKLQTQGQPDNRLCLNSVNATDMTYLFFRCNALPYADLSKLHTESLELSDWMFGYCTSLTGEGLDLSGLVNTHHRSMAHFFDSCTALQTFTVPSDWDSSQVSFMNYLMQGCTSLVSVDFSGLLSDSATTFDAMFKNCKVLKSVTFPEDLNTENVRIFTSMFCNCSALPEVDISMFDTERMMQIGAMFSGCGKLKTIYASDSFVLSALDSPATSVDVFNGCTILCGGEGTVWSSSHITADRAVIDAPENPGYFTRKNTLKKMMLMPQDILSEEEAEEKSEDPEEAEISEDAENGEDGEYIGGSEPDESGPAVVQESSDESKNIEDTVTDGETEVSDETGTDAETGAPEDTEDAAFSAYTETFAGTEDGRPDSRTASVSAEEESGT